MKKIIILLTILIITGCKSSEIKSHASGAHGALPPRGAGIRSRGAPHVH